MKLAVSIGELSADEHAAEVVEALKGIDQELEVQGMGGRNLRRVGVRTLVDSEKEASVMGFKEVLGAGAKVFRSFSAMESLLKEWKPDALLLLDYAEFNMRLARKAKALRIPVVYYIPPQMWAWREGRVELMKRYVDLAALIFPFEKEFYRARGYEDTRYVGHPFINRFKDRLKRRETTRSTLGLKDKDKVVAIFPGSRASEIERHVNVVRKAVSILRERHENLVPIIGVAQSLKEGPKKILSELERNDKIVLYGGDSFDLLAAGDSGIIKSGTSNLQAAFAELPFVMIYKASIVSEIIARILVPTRVFSIVNVLRSETVLELVQGRCTPEAISDETEKLLFDSSSRNEMLQGFKKIVQDLSSFEKAPEFERSLTVADRVASMVVAASARRNVE